MAVPAPDVQAIASLLKRERFYRDTAQWDLCRATFHPDAAQTYINVAWYEGDVESFLRRSAQMHTGNNKINIIHSSYDPIDIHIRGHRAISEAFCLVTSSIILDGVECELAAHMRLFSRLKKLEDCENEWRLLSIEAGYVRDRLVTAVPGAGGRLGMDMCDDDEEEEAKAYPRGYRRLAMVMLKRGLRPRLDLPNEDDEESVRGIGERNRAFLHEC